MKALILSGGKGTRLRPITHTAAKQLVPVANKPILFYAIEAMSGAGITEVGIVVGDTHEEVRAAVGNGEKWGVKVTYIPQEAPLGLAHAVMISEEFINDEDFVMFLGDNLIRDGVASFRERYEKSGANAQILLAHVPNPQDFGVAELNGDKVIRLIEKPANPPSDLALVGVYMFDHNIFKAVNSIKPSARGEYEITDAIQYLIENGFRVEHKVVDGWWKDTGKLEDMLEANRLVLDSMIALNLGAVDCESEIHGRVSIGKGSKIINSSIRGPAIIGENCLVENTFIGPYSSINDRVTIRASEIEHSIVLEDSQILDIGCRMADSLVGKNVKIGKSNKKPQAYRIMVGDNSEVSVI
jgi:glucose-1-phosphate thymidylyltransferase